MVLALKAAMLPETTAGKKAKMRVESQEKELTMEVASHDLVSFRASMNTNLRLIASAMRTIDSVGSTKLQKD
jgi:tRNA threonylcarbamoyladenosine modification (KEOPS) complex  Pcc1 subunit